MGLPALRDAVPKLLAHPAPPEASFRDWAAALVGPEACELLVGLVFVFTFDYDPGRLSAAFISERLGRVVEPDVVRYVVGGWQALVGQLTVRAGQAGVIIETRTRARELPPRSLVVATPPATAQRMLGAHIHAISARVGLADVAVATNTPPPSGVLDLDERLYLARYPPMTAPSHRPAKCSSRSSAHADHTSAGSTCKRGSIACSIK